MQINGPIQIHGPHGMNAPHAPFRGQLAQESPSTKSVDRVDISAAAEAAIQASEGGEVRHDLVNQIRAQLAAGTYESAEKLDVAIDRLLDEIA